MVYSLYELLWFFLLYSFLGWCAGVAAEALRKRAFINTGFLTLPFCPVYGVGAVVFSIFLPELRGSLFFLFLEGAVISAFLTFVTGFLLERIFRRKWWDFTQSRFQFEGYISVPLLAVWGLLAVVCIRFTDPLLSRALRLIPRSVGRIVLLVLYILLALDFLVSLLTVLRLRFTRKRLRDLQEDFRNVSSNVGNAITGHIQGRVMRAYPNLAQAEAVPSHRERRRETGFAPGCCFDKLVWIFLIAALCGDLIEMLFCRLTGGVWMSRSSVVWGPFSVVWGLGGMMLTAFLYRYRDRRDAVIFTAGTVLGGAYEYLCSVFTELVFGTVFWDYSAIPFNLGGRINLLYCFFWGIAAVVWLKGVYPRLSDLIERIPPRFGKMATWVLIAFMVVNMAVSALALGRYTQRHTEPETEPSILTETLDRRFPDSRMEAIYPNAKLVD